MSIHFASSLEEGDVEPTDNKEIDATMENGLIGIIREAKVAGKRVFNRLQQIRYSRADQEFTESDDKMSEKERRNSKESHQKSGIDLLAWK